MEISPVSQEHPDDDIWEEYVFGRLVSSKEAAVEEHLLLCERCQNALARTGEFVQMMKFATASLAVNRFAVKQRKHGWKVPQFGSGIGSVTAASAGTIAAACIVALLWIGPARSRLLDRTTPPAASVPVPLKSFRGGSEAAMNRAPAKHPLDLSIPLADVPASAPYRLQVVTFWGETIWSGTADTKDGALSAHVAKRLGAGTYWVRLYAPSSELLAEYGLKLD